jgi:hypothetical protein
MVSTFIGLLASCTRPVAMSLADYQHAIAVSIGGLTSKRITDSSNIIKVIKTALYGIDPEVKYVVNIFTQVRCSVDYRDCPWNGY